MGVFHSRPMTKNERSTLFITGGSHLSVHSLMLVLPNILLVLQQEFDVGLASLGFIATASMLMFGLGAIPTGALESRIGGRQLILVYHLGSALATVVIILSQSLAMLTVGLVLLGLFSSIYHPSGLTLISRRLSNISKGMAFHGIAGSLGLAIGPILTSGFADLLSWRWAYGTLGLFNIFLALMTMITIPYRSPQGDTEDVVGTGKTNKKSLILYYSIAVLMGLSYTGFTTFMPTHFALQTRGIFSGLSDTFRGGLFTTVVLAAGIIGQISGGIIGHKYSRIRVIIWIVLLNIPFLALIGLTTGIPMLIFGIILGIVHFNFQPVGNSLVADLTHSSHRGLGYGVSFFLNFGVGSIAAGIGGIIAERAGVATVFPVMAAVLIPGIMLAFLLRRRAETPID